MDEPLPIKYENIVEPEQISVQEQYASIIEYKKNQMKINLVLALPQTDESEKQELKQLKENIQIALKEMLTSLKELEKKKSLYPLSLQLLTMEDVGKLTKCFITEDRKWKNAQVIDVDVEQQIGKVKRYGQEEMQQFPAYYLKVLKEPDPQAFKEGTFCKAIYSADGEFYHCTIEKIDEQGYHVRYKKYNSRQVVKLHRLRQIQNQTQMKEEIKFDNLQQLKIPDKLKVQPNDPESLKKSKKNKVKALKHAFKKAQLDEVNNEKKEKWKNWNEGSGKTGHFKSKHNMQTLYSKQKRK